MNIQTCPTPMELTDFVLGLLPDLQCGEIEEHLEQCAPCSSVLEKTGSLDDALSNLIRGTVPPDEYCQETEFVALMTEITGSFAPDQPIRDNKKENPPEKIGPYEIRSTLGEGGMGTVYLAWHLMLEREVAIKMLSSGRRQSALALARFRREMKGVGRLEHPNIVRAYDAGEDSGALYLVMERIDGENLAELTRQEGRLEIGRACELIQQAAVGLGYAASHGLVHRDVKPSNLMLSADGTVKLMDLGLALLHDDDGERTDEGSVMGSFDYISPEQASGSGDIDARADIYSLGCTLFYLLTRKAPFADQHTTAGKIRAHIDESLPEICELRPDVPQELADVIRKMTAKSPGERFASAGDVARALEPFAESCRAGLQPAKDAESKAGWKPAPRSDRPSLARRVGVAVAALLVGVLLATVFYIETGKGKLEVTVNEPGFQLTIDGKPPRIEIPSEKIVVRVRIRAGKHVLEVSKDGFATAREEFSIQRGGKIQLVLRLIPDTPKTEPKPAPPKTGDADILTVAPAPLPDTDVIPGIVPAPAKYPGIARWQIVSTQPRSEIRSVDWSPNGLIACGTRSGELRIYDSRTMRLVAYPIGHTRSVNTVRWSPDGKLLASGSSDRTIRLWKPDGTPLTAVEDLYKEGRFVWSPDSKQIVARNQGTTIRIWNTDGTPGEELEVEAHSLAWHPQGRILAAAKYKQIQLIDLTGEAEPRLLDGHEDNVSTLAWSPDGKWLAAGDRKATVRLWAVDGAAGPVMRGNYDQISSISWNPAGDRLVVGETGPYDRFGARVWNVDGTPGPKVDPYKTNGVAWSPDGKQFVTGSDDATLRIWNNDGTLAREIGHDRGVWKLSWNPNNKLLISGGQDRRIRFWDASGKPGVVLEAHRGGVRSLAWKPDGKQFASAGDQYAVDSTVRIWADDGSSVAELTTAVQGAPRAAVLLAWSADGSRLAALTGRGSNKDEIHLWETDDWTDTLGHIPGRTLGWNHDGSLLLLKVEPQKVRFWSPEKDFGEHPAVSLPLPRTFSFHGIHPDGKRWAGAYSNAIWIWNSDGSTGPVFKHLGPDYYRVHSIAWSPDGHQMASGGYDKVVRVWNLEGTAGDVLTGHTDSIQTVAWGGKRIASGGNDTTIRLWDAKTGKPVWVALPLDETNSATFSADGKLLHGDADKVDEQLVYLVETKKDQFELMNHSTFLNKHAKK